MALDRDELAARATAARAALLSLCDALSALVPVAPASGAPATEPRRTVGAVVRDGTLRHYDEDDLLIVVADDPAACQRFLDNPRRDLSLADAYPEDEFVRWATREECERHGIPYVARPLPGAPLAAPSRLEWVRITSLNAGGKSFLTVGKVYRVTGFGHRGCPQVNNDQGDGMWCLSSRGLSPDPESPTFASWEPCAAPSPAATPAAWVPSVGDVIVVPYSRHPAPEWTKIVVSVGDETVRYESRNSRGEVLRPYGFCAPWGCVFVRRATSSERAAAGLPVDEAKESAVDRVALAKVLWRSWNGDDDVGYSGEVRDGYVRAADAAIAFMAKGGAS